MIRFLRKTDDFLAAVEKLLITLFTGALVLILTAQVILRYVFSRPLFWAEEISLQFLVFSTLIGLSLLLRSRRMIAIDMITSHFPDSWNHKWNMVLQFLGLVTIGYFAWHGTLWLLRPEVRMELSPTIGIPIWYNYAMFPLTFYAMAYHLLVGLLCMIFPPNEMEQQPC
jgi:TRAP-type C4-dicarboxylate transport system permease small subunit